MGAKTRKQQIEDLLADDPNDPFLRYGLAMEHVSAGADDEAVRCFGELLAVAPDYVPAFMQAALAYQRLGRLEEARAILTRGIAVAGRQGDQHAREEMTGFLAGLG
jgi:tetratricopeptide (TPR) repeat protein